LKNKAIPFLKKLIRERYKRWKSEKTLTVESIKNIDKFMKDSERIEKVLKFAYMLHICDKPRLKIIESIPDIFPYSSSIYARCYVILDEYVDNDKI